MDNLVANEGLVIGAIVVLGWIFNQGLKLIGVVLSIDGRKAIIFGVSVAFAVMADPLELGSPVIEPEYGAMVLAQIVLQFKAAQLVYDKIWKGLAKA